MDSSTATIAALASRDNIMKQIASQAASVRRTFEAHPSKRKHAVSSATAAAAQHMASLNRKRKFENHLAVAAPTPGEFVWNKSTSQTFHSPIASFTRPEKVRQVSNASVTTEHPIPMVRPDVVVANTDVALVAPTTLPTRVSDGIVLKSSPQDITVSYNDVVCGKGKTTSSLVGNQRYKVWVNLHKAKFAKAGYDMDARRNIACSIVDAVGTSVPQGRFLSLDIHTGLWYDVGRARAVGITMETLMSETGMMSCKNQGMMMHPGAMVRRASIPRTFTSKAA